MIKKVKELLESGAITQEVADQLNGEWKTHTQILNDENKSLREKNQELLTNFEEVAKSKEQLDEQLQGLDERIEQAKKDGQTEVLAQLEAEKTAKQELQTNLESIKKANQSLTIENGVQKALADYDMLDSEVVSTVLKQKVQIGENGELVYKEGEHNIPLEDGVKSFFERKPNLLKSVGEGGSGSGSGGSGNQKQGNFGGSKDERKGAIADMIASGS